MVINTWLQRGKCVHLSILESNIILNTCLVFAASSNPSPVPHIHIHPTNCHLTSASHVACHPGACLAFPSPAPRLHSRHGRKPPHGVHLAPQTPNPSPARQLR